MKVKEFFLNAARGAVIGFAVIIPGVSGGTLAVIMNVYDKIINAVSDIRRDFKNSIMFLLPILIGIVVAVAAMYLPLNLALDFAPFPTVMLFAGLMAGSCPKIVKDAIGKGFKKLNVLSLILPLLAVIGICLIPSLGNADLTAAMPWYGYILLVLVGALASCALVVPGVSGSLLLLILGYYNSIFDTVSALKTDFGHSVLVLLLLAIGIIIGFFSIAKLMKLFLQKFPRGTGWAICGFVIGSIPAIFLTYDRNFPEHVYSTLDTANIIVGVVLCVLGIIASYALTAYVESRTKKSLPTSEN